MQTHDAKLTVSDTNNSLILEKSYDNAKDAILYARNFYGDVSVREARVTVFGKLVFSYRPGGEV